MKVYETDSATYSGDGLAKVITLGYKPRQFVLENITDLINHVKTDTMPTSVAIQTVAAGTRTSQNYITLDSPLPGQISIAAAANIAGKVYHYTAIKGD